MTESIFYPNAATMLAESRLQISCLVLVDNVSLCQLVQHLLYNRVELNSLFLIRHATQLANSVTHSLCIISVVQGLNLVLTDSLQWWFVISPSLFSSFILLVVPSRVELLFREWKSLVLTDRRRDHSWFCGCKGRPIYFNQPTFR